MKHERRIAARARSLLGLVALVACGCTSVQQGGSQRTALMAATGSTTSATGLRAMNNVLAISVPGTIEAAADEVAAKAPDAAIQRRALVWKIQLIPAFYQALFYSDPLAAGLDAWCLSLQFEEAVTTGTYRDHLGAMQPIAVETAHRVRHQVEAALKSGASSAEGFERARAIVEKWVREHPVDGPLYARAPIIPDLARLAGAGLDVSVFQVVADMPATFADLATRMDIYAAYLPKSARWQAELVASDFADRAETRRALATLASVEKLTERTNALLSPAGLRDALDMASGQIRSERIAALASVDRQRVDTLASVDEQRVATLNYLTQERAAAVADIDRERDALVRQVDQLRRQVISDVDELSDRAIRKAALALALLLTLAAALAVIVIRLAPRLRSAGRGESPGPASGPSVGGA